MGKKTKGQQIDETAREARTTRAKRCQQAIATVLTEHDCELRAVLTYGQHSIGTQIQVIAKPDAVQEEAARKGQDADGKAEAGV